MRKFLYLVLYFRPERTVGVGQLFGVYRAYL